MSIPEYVVRRQDGLWEVWLGNRLLSGHPTQSGALAVANALADATAARGEPVAVLVREFAAGPIESAPLDQPSGAA
jgi:hypothetical protein